MDLNIYSNRLTHRYMDETDYRRYIDRLCKCLGTIYMIPTRYDSFPLEIDLAFLGTYILKATRPGDRKKLIQFIMA